MASRMMLNSCTVSVQATSVVHAWILTYSVDASLVAGTIRVGPAFRFGRQIWRVAVDVRISDVTVRALAHASVIFHAALSSVSAWIGMARADAASVQASQIRWALRVGFAEFDGRCVDSGASSGRVSDGIGWALANHRSDGQGIGNRTTRECYARLRHRARILTNALYASQLAWTVRVKFALWSELLCNDVIKKKNVFNSYAFQEFFSQQFES